MNRTVQQADLAAAGTLAGRADLFHLLHEARATSSL
jgi:hypothetical protein